MKRIVLLAVLVLTPFVAAAHPKTPKPQFNKERVVKR